MKHEKVTIDMREDLAKILREEYEDIKGCVTPTMTFDDYIGSILLAGLYQVGALQIPENDETVFPC